MGGQNIDQQVRTRNGATVVSLPDASDRLPAGQSNQTSSPAEVLHVYSDLNEAFPISEDELSAVDSFLMPIVQELLQAGDKTLELSSRKLR